MKKWIVGLWWVAVAIVVSFAWLLVYPAARQGAVGDAVWLVLALTVFVLLNFSTGGFRRFMMLFSLLSVLAALLTLLWPVGVWFPEWQTPASDTVLFLFSFVGLLLFALAMPPVRRLLHMHRAR